MSINTHLFNALIKSDIYFTASLKTLSLNKYKILTQEPWFLDLSSTSLKDLFQQATQNMFLFQVNQKWEKKCLGHEFKIAGRHNNKRKAQKKAKKAEMEYKQKPTIISHSVRWELRGINDPFVHFKYINNCSDCNCPSKKIYTKEKIYLNRIILNAEKKLPLPSEEFYEMLLQYILQSDEDSI